MCDDRSYNLPVEGEEGDTEAQRVQHLVLDRGHHGSQLLGPGGQLRRTEVGVASNGPETQTNISQLVMDTFSIAPARDIIIFKTGKHSRDTNNLTTSEKKSNYYHYKPEDDACAMMENLDNRGFQCHEDWRKKLYLGWDVYTSVTFE